jgi:hypothetical protein
LAILSFEPLSGVEMKISIFSGLKQRLARYYGQWALIAAFFPM